MSNARNRTARRVEAALRAALAVALLALGTGAGAEATWMPSRVWQEPKASVQPKLLAPSSAPMHAIALGVPGATERRTKMAAAPAPAGVPRPLQIGFNRDLSPAQRVIAPAGLTWQTLADGGRVAHVSVQSKSAAALRVQIALSGGSGGEVRFASPVDAAEIYGPYAADGTLWSPVIDGDTLVVELHLPPGRNPAQVSLSLATVAHLDRRGGASRGSPAPMANQIGNSDLCQVDIVCTSNPTPALLSMEKAVAKMVLTNSSGTFLCSGTLLSSSDPALPPYFYTANHCVNTQSTASSISTYWFFDAATCGGNTAPDYVQVGGGAQLMYGDQPSDVTLLKLNQRPPANVVYAGWNAQTVTPQTNLIGVHHPAGDLKKISRGRTYGYGDFNADTGAVIPGSDNKITITWSVFGDTEGGSSGSGLFVYNAARSAWELRGGLFGGGTGLTCAGPVADSYYSRFDRAYPALKQFLSP